MTDLVLVNDKGYWELISIFLFGLSVGLLIGGAVARGTVLPVAALVAVVLSSICRRLYERAWRQP